MIYKLQRKFILISMISVFIVLSAITVFINISNYININKNASRTIDLILENGGQFPKHPKNKDDFKPLSPDNSPEAPFSTRFFTVSTDESGEAEAINTGNIAAISTSEAATLAKEISKIGKATGFKDVYKYKISKIGDKNLVIFLDCSRELYTLKMFLINSTFVAVGGFLAVSVLIIIFSKVAVRPVAISYEKQKRFITDAGHELKTPLSIILANTEVLEMTSGESEWTRSIKNQVDRLSSLTSQLVTLTRMEESEHVFSMVDFSLSDAVLETAESFVSLANSQSKSINMNISKNISFIGDEQSIRQLLSILLDNAIKYSTDNGEITISLNIHGKHPILTVSNQTENLSKDNLELFFERFYRADESRNSEKSGYGLGLSIAKAIVDTHKGKISATTYDNKTLNITVQL